LGLLLWFALLGGLILNLMPCVFPVIGIKIMDFVKQSGQDKWRVTVHGLVFSLGILVTFWLLSGTLLFLRSRGEEVGWGFQLQNPWIVFGLVLLMFIFAMNMFGVFEFGTNAVGVGQNLTGKKGFVGSFFKGALAVVVSTPCSAPFLATALSAVITLPPAQMMLVFTFIALGLALPYLVLSSFPALIRKLPKPGPWMESFKQVMSFFLFGTAGYLLWVYGGLVDEFNLLYAILGLTMVALGLYVFGRWCSPLRSARTRTIGYAFLAALLAGGVWMGRPKLDTLEWKAWSPELQAQLLEEEKPFYIDFTARWCLTCQTNKAAYKNSEVAGIIRKKGITLLRADWTDRSETIREAIESYGKTAIPVNVLFIPGQEKPEVLPELLTPGVVLSYLEKVPDPKKE
ncbi:MAG: thioredoxin family protein, partial [Verrucomicrobiales bacterium]|nr:thioredoxin family protein [Verrucomicrobiales bacterium]